MVADTNISLQLVDVTGDSAVRQRVCIQGGDATVHMRILDSGETTGYELPPGDSRRASSRIESPRRAPELQPYPFSSRTIDPVRLPSDTRASRP